MKLVGGDSGRCERELLVEDVVLAPSERAVVDVLFEITGVKHKPMRTRLDRSVGFSRQIIRREHVPIPIADCSRAATPKCRPMREGQHRDRVVVPRAARRLAPRTTGSRGIHRA
jgi:hypothetical protein